MRPVVFISIFFLLFTPVVAASEKAANHFKVTILYDNYVHIEGTASDWGFSALVEGGEKTILFDTGTKPEILRDNIKALGVDLSAVDLVVISHNHGDHTGGLEYFLGENADVDVYLPASFPEAFFRKVEEIGARTVKVSGPVQICEGIYSTGDMEGPVREQSLIFDTGNSAAVMTGCAHPGIVNIISQASEVMGKKITFCFGGFHLMQKKKSEVGALIGEFEKAGIIRCGATHCTGDSQIGWFREYYGDKYVPMGVGRVIDIDNPGGK